MVFADEQRTSVVKVLSFYSVKEMSPVLNLPPQCISNYYHQLIKPRGVLKYVAMFKD